ncbi:hypothetical protein Pmani_001577 [Petrolisthes manimaculis]|uniref:Uncharacterized protein n=1 Tax=Petrolisthes manimaculis TaxID=1843537 RepID=A0AAE1QMR2_9EUCA|nr:hypothetical protein Pmani_001577 [Petrolisthes manimaculis]
MPEALPDTTSAVMDTALQKHSNGDLDQCGFKRKKDGESAKPRTNGREDQRKILAEDDKEKEAAMLITEEEKKEEAESAKLTFEENDLMTEVDGVWILRKNLDRYKSRMNESVTPAQKKNIQKFFHGMLENRLKEDERLQLNGIEKNESKPKENEDDSIPYKKKVECTPTERYTCKYNPKNVKRAIEHTASLVESFLQENESKLVNSSNQKKDVQCSVQEIFDGMCKEDKFMTNYNEFWIYRCVVPLLKKLKDKKIKEIKAARIEAKNEPRLTDKEEMDLNKIMYHKMKKESMKVIANIEYSIMERVHSKTHQAANELWNIGKDKKNLYKESKPLVLIHRTRRARRDGKKKKNKKEIVEDKKDSNMVHFWGVLVHKKNLRSLEKLNAKLCRTTTLSLMERKRRLQVAARMASRYRV